MFHALSESLRFRATLAVLRQERVSRDTDEEPTLSLSGKVAEVEEANILG